MRYFLLLFFLTIFVKPAHAYIDPGTGSMLLYAFLGFATAFLYALKGFFYKFKYYITGERSSLKNDLREYDFVLYSEGKHYWCVFKPLVKALTEKGKKCMYLASSEEDEGLVYKSGEYYNTLFIGKDVKAAVFLNSMSANIVIMATPQLDILTVRRSKKVKHYSHIFHSIADIGIYARYAFEYFDSVLCAAVYHKRNILEFEKRRNSPAKLLLETGYTPFDYLDEAGTAKNERKNEKPVVLVAPTWSSNSLLTLFEMKILEPLLTGEFNVILRPHPQMFVSQKDLIEKIRKATANNPYLVWDTAPSGASSMAESDIMISDLSGIIIEYSFIYKKPVITIDTPVITTGLEADDMELEDIWEVSARESLGKLVDEKEIENLPEVIGHVISDFNAENIDKIIDENIYNFKNAGPVAADQLIKISEDLNNNG